MAYYNESGDLATALENIQKLAARKTGSPTMNLFSGTNFGATKDLFNTMRYNTESMPYGDNEAKNFGKFLNQLGRNTSLAALVPATAIYDTAKTVTDPIVPLLQGLFDPYEGFSSRAGSKQQEDLDTLVTPNNTANNASGTSKVTIKERDPYAGLYMSAPKVNWEEIPDAPEVSAANIGKREEPSAAAMLFGGGLGALGDALAYGLTKGKVGGTFDVMGYINNLRNIKDKLYNDKLNMYKMDRETQMANWENKAKVANYKNDLLAKQAGIDLEILKGNLDLKRALAMAEAKKSEEDKKFSTFEKWSNIAAANNAIDKSTSMWKTDIIDEYGDAYKKAPLELVEKILEKASNKNNKLTENELNFILDVAREQPRILTGTLQKFNPNEFGDGKQFGRD